MNLLDIPGKGVLQFVQRYERTRRGCAKEGIQASADLLPGDQLPRIC